MSQEKVELVRRFNAMFNRGERKSLWTDFDPDIEWRDLMHAPDTPERVCGVPAVRAMVEQWDRAFEDFTAEIKEIIEVGDCVVTVTHWRGTGKSSDVATDLHAAEVAEFKEGKIVRVTVGYPDKRTALAAVGLRE
jgi:ketosteroid isomerase-like protein